MTDTYNSLDLIFLDFRTICVLTVLMKFSALLTLTGQLHALVTKNMKLPFCKSKLGMQSLKNIGLSAWNKLVNDINNAVNVNKSL